ncbi:MAG: metal-dependent transcriptional regulator [Anaerolineales bacterium]
MKILSAAVEDYLKSIHELEHEQEGERVSTSSLADCLKVSSASVTGMLKKLAQMEPQLVDYQPYAGVRLTEAGEKIAREVLRHHRLIEAYLMEALGYSWDEVHEEADQLEHVISESLAARIAEFLGHPEVDPHGDPIPSLEGDIPLGRAIPLADLEPGESGAVVRVVDDPKLLRYLDELNIELASIIDVRDRGPFEGPLHIQVRGQEVEHALSQRAAEKIFVQNID